MNIQTLNDYINLFREQVIESGFRRDLKDFTASLPNNDDNIISLREVANKVYATLVVIHGGDLPQALPLLIPGASPPPFTNRNYNNRLRELIEDKTIEQTGFYRSLNSLLNELANDVESNAEAVDGICDFLSPYVKNQKKEISIENRAIVSIIFRDIETVTDLHSFSRILTIWDRTLPLYHQLVTHTSPDSIKIVGIQNGSIDVVLNVNVDVAINLAELFKYGLLAFSAYLAHKKFITPISGAYFNNQRLREIDEEKEKVLLENVGEAVAQQARAQHERGDSSNVEIDNPDKIIESIRNLVTAHIVRGNEYKILALPEEANRPAGPIDADVVSKELSEATSEVKATLSSLPPDTTNILLKEYGSYHKEIDTQDSTPSKSSKSSKKNTQ